MAEPLRKSLKAQGSKAGKRPEPPPAASVWTEAKLAAVLAALNTFVHNQANKHGVSAAEVWALVRDEALDPEGRH